MATTTNYGWTTPDDTALVKDGASAIRTLGSSVDTTTKNLNPSTTLGDIEYRSSTANTNTRLGIGTSGQALTVVAGVPSWAASATSTLTTTGDLLYASAANTLARRAIGTSGQVLTVSGGVPAWAAAPAATDSWTLLNAGGTALTGASTITVSGISGKDKLFVVITGASSTVQSTVSLRFNTDSTNVYYTFGGQGQGLSAYATTVFKEVNNSSGTNQLVLGQMSTDTASTVSGTCLITGCSSSTNVKFFQSSGGATAATGNNASNYTMGGYVNLTAAITSVSACVPGGGNLDAGTIFVYANS